MRHALFLAALLCACAGDPSPTAADVSADTSSRVDASAELAELDAVDASADTSDAPAELAELDAVDASADTSDAPAELAELDAVDASADTSDAPAELAELDAVDASADRSDVSPVLTCPRGLEFDRCSQVGALAPCCAVDSRTTIPLGCGCLVAPFRCVARGQSGCP